MVNSTKDTPPALARATVNPTPGTPVPPVVPVVEPKKPQQHVMDFLKRLSEDVKNAHPKLPPSIADKIDAYIRDHGNRHPETTK